MRRIVWVPVLCAVAIALSCTKTVYVPIQQHRSCVAQLRDTMVAIVADGEQYDNKTIDTISCIYGSRAMSCATVSQGVLSHLLTIYPQRDTIDMQLRDTYIIDSVPYIVAPPDNEGRSKPNFSYWPIVAWSLLVVVLCIVVLLRSVRN